MNPFASPNAELVSFKTPTHVVVYFLITFQLRQWCGHLACAASHPPPSPTVIAQASAAPEHEFLESHALRHEEYAGDDNTEWLCEGGGGAGFTAFMEDETYQSNSASNE